MPEKRDLAPIPIPLWRRWQDFRMKVVPAAVFCVSLAAFIGLWMEHVSPPTMLGEVEAHQATLRSPAGGMLHLRPFQPFDLVHAGEAVGEIITTPASLVQHSLDVIASEIDQLRIGMEPVVNQQRNEVNYEGLRLDWMTKRVDLATVQVNLQQHEGDLRRYQELYSAGLASEEDFEAVRNQHRALEVEAASLQEVVETMERHMARLENSVQEHPQHSLDEQLYAAIAVQEKRLSLAEAQMRPLPLIAPAEGMIGEVYQQDGEYLLAGEPILRINAEKPLRIVAYLKQPVNMVPEVGTQVTVRTRDRGTAAGTGEVLSVGARLEPAPLSVHRALNIFSEAETVLPVLVSLPQNLSLRPGELVDLIITPTRPAWWSRFARQST